MEKAILVGVWTHRKGEHGRPISEVDFRDSLLELEALLKTAGGEKVFTIEQKLNEINPSTYIGKGKLEELQQAVAEFKPQVVIFDNELSPTQLRNIEEVIECRVIDRTQLILDIFALHAKTREGILQVDLAQTVYNLPRLIGMGNVLSRLGGGIGTRGPGESKLEAERRRLRLKISKLKKELKELEKQREVQRKSRLDSNVPIVSIVGYTNSGKSTLLKVLSKDADILTEDALFVTLSPVTRKIWMQSGKQIVMNDTVGFIQGIPHTIIEAFKATLEEIRFSHVLLNIVDANDPLIERKMQASKNVLEQIGVSYLPTILVFNKCDLLSAENKEWLQNRYPEALLISALKGDNLQSLMSIVESKLSEVASQAR